jgi:hypothetical protein
MTEPKVNGVAETKAKPGLQPIQTGNYPGIPNTYSPTSSTAGGGNAFDDIIPHPDEVHHRNLILCFDGTGDQFDADVRDCRLTEYTCYVS